MFRKILLPLIFSVQIICAQTPEWRYFDQSNSPITNVNTDIEISIDSSGAIWAVSGQNIMSFNNNSWKSLDSSIQKVAAYEQKSFITDIVCEKNNQMVVSLKINDYEGRILIFDNEVWTEIENAHSLLLPFKLLTDNHRGFWVKYSNWWGHQTGFDRVGKFDGSKLEMIKVDFLDDIMISDSLIFALGSSYSYADSGNTRGIFSFSKSNWQTEYEKGKLIFPFLDSIYFKLTIIDKIRDEFIICGNRFFTVKDSVLSENTLINPFLSLHSTIITSIHVEHDSIIWLGTDGGHILKYSNNSLVVYDFLSEMEANSKKITDIEIDRDGNKWLGVNGVGIVEFNEDKIVSVENEIDRQLPNKIVLSQNYPNPFNPSTTINIYLPNRTNVKLCVYDILGREISVVANGEYESGIHKFKFSAEHFTSGIYFYQILTNEFSQTRKMILIK